LEAVSIPQIFDKLGQLPAMPAVVQEVINSFDDPHLEVDKLAAKISQDQGLAARVLRIANSSFYGLSRQVASIHDAVVVLGFGNIRSMAMAAGFVHAFSHTSPGLFDRKQFWRHSLRVAACARVLAKCCRQNQETAFTAGLLHDIGLLVLDTCLHKPFNTVLERLSKKGGDLHQLEQEMLGFDHAVVGAEMAKRWNFPALIQQVIQSHHLAGVETDKVLTCIVHLSNVLVRALDTGASEGELLPRLPPGLCARFGLLPETLQACLPEIEQMVASADLLLEG
jgi:putative nucleotidyltransferase with HDIG domain